jgi:hypothetical protein
MMTFVDSDRAEMPIAGVCERDIDLLLLEEFIASVHFIQWFTEQINRVDAEIECLLSAQRSVTQSNGESDLEVYCYKIVAAV